MPKANTAILKYLKDQGRKIDIPLNDLRQFQEFEKTVQAAMKSYDHLPPTVAFGMRSFHKIEMLGIALIMSGDYPAAQRCLDDVMKRFNSDSAFTDGVTLLAWVLFNFPIRPNGNTVASEVLRQSPDLAAELSLFVDALNRSRLGLYEVIHDARETCKIKELFTGTEVTLNQTLGGVKRGNIAVVRVIKLMDQYWSFGDTNEFPAERRTTIENMVADKMDVYFPAKHPAKSYELMMRLAGPYWFSVVAHDFDSDILNTDHYLSYYD